MTPLFLASVAAIPFIALANILFGILLIGTLIRRERIPLDPPTALLLVCGLTAVTAAVTSLNPVASLASCKDQVNLLILPLAVLHVRRVPRARLQWLFAGQALFLSLWGYIEYTLRIAKDPAWRIRGPLSHYMTYSGILLILILINIATYIKAEESRLRATAAVAACAGAGGIVLSLTRNSWVGLAVGLLLLAVATRRRILLAAIILFGAILAIPAANRERLQSLTDRSDPSNNDRIAMMAAGIDMYLDYPLTGVGPDRARHLYPFYRKPWSTRPRIPHLHNNVIQLAAERGSAGLAAYIAFLAVLLAGAWRRRKNWGGLATLASCGAISAAGLFEWNFGDTEVLMMTLVAASLHLADDDISMREGSRSAARIERADPPV